MGELQEQGKSRDVAVRRCAAACREMVSSMPAKKTIKKRSIYLNLQYEKDIGWPIRLHKIQYDQSDKIAVLHKDPKYQLNKLIT